MAAQFANLYIDRVFSEKDLGLIYHLVRVREMQRELPEEFWLFCRIYEWAPARSGVWQYYEGLSEEAFMRMNQTMERFGLFEVAAQYRQGWNTWNAPDRAAALDEWLDLHAQQIHAAAFALIVDLRDWLKEND